MLPTLSAVLNTSCRVSDCTILCYSALPAKWLLRVTFHVYSTQLAVSVVNKLKDFLYYYSIDLRFLKNDFG